MTGAAATNPATSVVTLNNLGRTTTQLNEINARFVEVSRTAKRPVLDIGCAMGVATHAALKVGATVHANDVDPEHLAIVARDADAASRHRLELHSGRFPHDLAFEAGGFDAVHASNLLNFLSGEEIETGLAAIAHWLAPNGLFLSISGTPYAANIRNFIPDYEAGVARGERWPGECDDLRRYSDDPTMSELPPKLHLLDPDVLARSARKVGLHVEEARFFSRQGTPDYIRLDGRENVMFVARKRPQSAGRSDSRGPDGLPP